MTQELKEHRELKEIKEIQEPREHREPKEHRELKEIKEIQEPREHREPKEHRELKEIKEIQVHKVTQELKEHRELKVILEPMALQTGPFPFFQIIQKTPSPSTPVPPASDCTDYNHLMDPKVVCQYLIFLHLVLPRHNSLITSPFFHMEVAHSHLFRTHLVQQLCPLSLLNYTDTQHMRLM